MSENIFQRKARELGGARLDFIKADVDYLKSNPNSNGTTDHSLLAGLEEDDHDQYLTTDRADARYYTKSQSDALIPVFWDSNARRFGCKALSFTPHDVNPDDPQSLRLATNRMYVVGLSVPPGELISFVRIPIVEKMTSVGALEFSVFNEDLSLLGQTGDVSSEFSAGNDQTWRNVNLETPANTTGNIVYICMRSTADQSGNMLVFFPDITLQGTVPSWLYGNTGVYIDNVTVMPSTLDFVAAQAYYDILIGIG